MDFKPIQFASMILFIVPVLVTCAVGLILSLLRRELGERARYGAFGFGLMTIAAAIRVMSTYVMVYLTDPGDFASTAKTTAGLGLLSTVVETAGLIILVLAVIHRERRKPSAA